MGTTIDDIHYEQYLDDLHNSYFDALERFSNSKNLNELRENLEDLEFEKDALKRTFGENRSLDTSKLEEVLRDVATLEKLYSALLEQKKQSKVYFVVGLVIGSLVTVVSSLFL